MHEILLDIYSRAPAEKPSHLVYRSEDSAPGLINPLIRKFQEKPGFYLTSSGLGIVSFISLSIASKDAYTFFLHPKPDLSLFTEIAIAGFAGTLSAIALLETLDSED